MCFHLLHGIRIMYERIGCGGVVMQVKRKALVAVDGKLSGLAESRAVKDEEMKGLERTLVQVLVEQQKKLLSLLSEVGLFQPLDGSYPVGWS